MVDQTEESPRTAVARFRDLDMPFNAALFLLYLADLLLVVGRLREGEQSLIQALELFRSCQLRRYMVMALGQLEEAIRRKHLVPQISV